MPDRRNVHQTWVEEGGWGGVPRRLHINSTNCVVLYKFAAWTVLSQYSKLGCKASQCFVHTNLQLFC